MTCIRWTSPAGAVVNVQALVLQSLGVIKGFRRVIDFAVFQRFIDISGEMLTRTLRVIADLFEALLQRHQGVASGYTSRCCLWF